MKALVYEKPGRKYSSIREIPYPQCESDDIIIKVMSASICKGVEHDHDQEGVGTDLAVYPVVPGHEFSGYVEEVGENVTKFKKGDVCSSDLTVYVQTTQNIVETAIIAEKKNQIIVLHLALWVIISTVGLQNM